MTLGKNGRLAGLLTSSHLHEDVNKARQFQFLKHQVDLIMLVRSISHPCRRTARFLAEILARMGLNVRSCGEEATRIRLSGDLSMSDLQQLTSKSLFKIFSISSQTPDNTKIFSDCDSVREVGGKLAKIWL